MNKLAVSLMIALSVYGVGACAGELTAEQCEDYLAVGFFHLTDAQEKAVLDSCKKRYSSENALGNCTAFEGQDKINELKKIAEKECK